MERCVLLRHGTAEEEGERPLTEQGKGEALRGAQRLVSHLKVGEVGEVYVGHSGKLRARQTAELVAEALQGAGWKAGNSDVVQYGIRNGMKWDEMIVVKAIFGRGFSTTGDLRGGHWLEPEG